MFKYIKIKGFRGFGEEEVISFSLPNSKLGSGLTVLVGPNNSGKTTILEAIRYYGAENSSPTISFSEGKRNRKCDNRVTLSYVDENDLEFKIKTVPAGGSEVSFPEQGTRNSNNKKPYVLQARRFADYEMHNNHHVPDRDSYLTNFGYGNSRNRTASLYQFEQRIFKWQKNKEKFDTVLKRVITDQFDWNIEQNDSGAYYIKIIFNNGDIVHTREGMGDGYWSIFTIADALYDSREGDIIAIDEPELSLHPAFQERLLDLFLEYSKDRQIIISTHSSKFVSLLSLENGGGLVRTHKDNKGNICINSITDDDRIFLGKILENINNPHIFGLSARELFFLEDNILITEGQEDVILIPKICKSLGITLRPSLFGWGAGGAGNIASILRLFRHLGFKKVTAIFDGDMQSKYEDCKDEFKDYNIVIWPADDIRDKDAVNKPAKSGLTDSSGNVKPDFEDSVIQIFEKINEYNSEN